MALQSKTQVCLKDALFEPASLRLTVEDVVSEERRRRERGEIQSLAIDQARPSELDATFFRGAGYGTVCLAENESPSDLARRAITNILVRNQLRTSDIDLLIFYNTNPYIPEIHFNIPNKLINELDLPNIKFQTHLSQKNCTSGLAAAQVAKSLMEADPSLRWGLVAGGDCIDLENGQPRIVARQIHSDAGSAMLLGRTGTPIRYLANKSYSLGWKRFSECPAVMYALSLNYLRWSLEQIGVALGSTGLTFNDLSLFVTNQELIDQHLRTKEKLPEATISFFRSHLQTYAHTLAHEVVAGIEHVLHTPHDSPAIAHATGMGTLMSTMVVE